MVNEAIDLSSCPINYASAYGGSDRKFGILYNHEPYMIKFAEHKDDASVNNPLATSSVNNCFSEYIGSHIAQSIGLTAHETILGYYKNELVVACKDFTSENQVSQEFAHYMRMRYDSKDIGKIPKYEQLYDVISSVDVLCSIKGEAINRYWETFVVDALLANFDRHKGNWGYLADRNTGRVSLAPTYDYGSTLYPSLSKARMDVIISDPYEICKRIFVFPTAALIINGVKANYYDVMSSDFDHNCSEAVKKIVPLVDLNKIDQIVDTTPIVSEKQKVFYKTMLHARKKLILDVAFEKVSSVQYDLKAYERLKSGTPYDANFFDKEWSQGKFADAVDDLTIKCFESTQDEDIDTSI